MADDEEFDIQPSLTATVTADIKDVDYEAVASPKNGPLSNLPALHENQAQDFEDIDYDKKALARMSLDEEQAEVFDEDDFMSPKGKQLGLSGFGLDAANSPKASSAKATPQAKEAAGDGGVDSSLLPGADSPKQQERPNTSEFCARPATAPAPKLPDEPHVTPESPVFADETRQALLHAAALTDPKDRMARHLALNSLQRLATGAQNKAQLWEDEGFARKVILDAAAMEDPEDNEGRCCALGTLWNIAGDTTLRGSMWGDDTTRSIVLKAVQSETAEVRDLALGILWGLSPKANAAPMWQEESVRAAVMKAASSEQADGRKGRSYALAILQNLAEETENRAAMWADADGVRVALKAASGLTNPEDKDLRGRALGAFMNLSVEAANKEDMWNDAEGARAAILEAANLAPGLDDKSRSCALAAVWCLAIEQKNRVAMHSEEKVRSALVQAAAVSGDRRSRERALGTMQYLSTEGDNKTAMWADEGVRDALVASVSTSCEGKAKVYGLGAIWNLSSCPKNQEKMWRDEEAREAVIQVGLESGPEDALLQERAMAILWNLSTAGSNKAAMWKDKQGRDGGCPGSQRR